MENRRTFPENWLIFLVLENLFSDSGHFWQIICYRTSSESRQKAVKADVLDKSRPLATYFSHTNPINRTRRSQYRLLTERSNSEFELPVLERNRRTH